MMTPEDKEWIHLTTKELVRSVSKELFETHIITCPHGRTLLKSKMLLLGYCMGSGIISGGLVVGLRFIIGF